MTNDKFDQFLADALRPADRDEDPLFARQVIKRIGIEHQLRKQRLAIARRFAFDLLALLSVSAAMVAISRSPVLQDFATEQTWALLVITLIGFGAWIWISSSALLRSAASHSI